MGVQLIPKKSCRDYHMQESLSFVTNCACQITLSSERRKKSTTEAQQIILWLRSQHRRGGSSIRRAEESTSEYGNTAVLIESFPPSKMAKRKIPFVQAPSENGARSRLNLGEVRKRDCCYRDHPRCNMQALTNTWQPHCR